MTHEFEAFLFSNTAETASLIAMNDEERLAYEAALDSVLAQCGSPELVNTNDPPSKRIRAMCRRYQKVLHGPTITGIIGVAALRVKCERFGAWIDRLESFAHA